MTATGLPSDLRQDVDIGSPSLGLVQEPKSSTAPLHIRLFVPPLEAQQTLESLRKKSGSVDPLNTAVVYLGLGDRTGAVEALENAERAGSLALLLYVKTDPVFDKLRPEPRFRALLAKMGLAD